MEVINGEHGDVVPKLAQAVLSGDCDAFNNRYKVCLPTKAYSDSRAPSIKHSKSNGNRDSNSCLSTNSSNPSQLSVDEKASFQMYSSGTDTSSKDSSEEVSNIKDLLLARKSLVPLYYGCYLLVYITG